MKKRFTDSDKWVSWFRELTPIFKCLWLYLLDNCDIAGVWKVDKKKAEFDIGSKIEWPKIAELFGDRIMEFDGGEKWYLTKYIEFQQGNYLKEHSSVHGGIIKLLKYHGIYDLVVKDNQLLSNPLVRVSKGLGNPYSYSNSNSNSKERGVQGGKQKEKMCPFPEFDIVKMTEEEYKKLVEQFGEVGTKDRIKSLHLYMGSNGKKYANHYLTILNWERRDESKSYVKKEPESWYGPSVNAKK